MKTYISAWPIDKAFQQAIGIYDSSFTPKEKIGEILSLLIEDGYTKIQTFVDSFGGEPYLKIHCKKES